jgi:hypothetical protein
MRATPETRATYFGYADDEDGEDSQQDEDEGTDAEEGPPEDRASLQDFAIHERLKHVIATAMASWVQTLRKVVRPDQP